MALAFRRGTAYVAGLERMTELIQTIERDHLNPLTGNDERTRAGEVFSVACLQRTTRTTSADVQHPSFTRTIVGELVFAKVAKVF